MLARFRSKAQMNLYIPPEKFGDWPEDTFGFCPKCGIDNFELLSEYATDTFIRCHVCGSLWTIKSAGDHIHCKAATGVS